MGWAGGRGGGRGRSTGLESAAAVPGGAAARR